MRQEARSLYARTMKRALKTAPALLILLVAAGCEGPSAEPRVTVEHAAVTLPPIPGRPGAAYFTLTTNHGPARLVGVASPRIGRIELHESIDEGGVSRMVPLREPAFAPGAPLVFEPGGRHAMLFAIDPALRPGDRVALTFTFDPAPPVTVEAEIRAAGDHGGH